MDLNEISNKGKWAISFVRGSWTSHPAWAENSAIGLPRPFPVLNMDNITIIFRGRFLIRIALVLYLGTGGGGVGDIPPSFSDGLPPKPVLEETLA